MTGWAISPAGGPGSGDSRRRDAAEIYDKLERETLPLFCERHGVFVDIMRHAIALNGSFFNSHRMLQQFVSGAYFF